MPPALTPSRLAWAGDLPESRAACGMGFVATPELGHEAVQLGVQALARLAHRGGLDADGKSGDGAGLLIQVPERLLGARYGVIVLFEWDARARDLVERHLPIATWREVPVDVESLGPSARETMPAIWHGLMTNPGLDADAWERDLYRARRRIERCAEAELGGKDGLKLFQSVASNALKVLVS